MVKGEVKLYSPGFLCSHPTLPPRALLSAPWLSAVHDRGGGGLRGEVEVSLGSYTQHLPAFPVSGVPGNTSWNISFILMGLPLYLSLIYIPWYFITKQKKSKNYFLKLCFDPQNAFYRKS